MKVKFSSVITICLVFVFINLAKAQINKPASGGKNEPQTTTTTPTTTNKTNSKTNDEKSSFLDKVFFGGNVGINYYNGWLIQLAPTVGYRVNNAFSLAAGVNLQYVEYFNPSILYGAHLTSRFKPLALMENENSDFFGLLKNGYLIAEGNIIKNSNTSYNRLLFGGGISLPVGGLMSFNVEALYNVAYQVTNLVEPKPWVLRVTTLYNF